MLSELKFKEFLSKTSSNDPVPGGGSVSAMAGALAASLSEMVANLTIGRKGFEEVTNEMERVVNESRELQKLLTEDIDRDSNAYNEVMKAFKLPKESNEDKKSRSEAIQKATKNASLVPLDVARRAAKIIDLTEIVVNHGNRNAVTDGLVGCMMARTAVLGALYNVKINLSSIKDKDFVEELQKEVSLLEKTVVEKEQKLITSTMV